MTAPITALGIRTGEPDVLRALVARRGAAVLAYCEQLSEPGRAPEALADAFARFRRTVLEVARAATLDPELVLLGATRHAAAARAPRPVPDRRGGLGRLLRGGPDAATLALVPQLLAARAQRELSPADEERLARLLAASPEARRAEDRFHAAEDAYRRAAPRELPGAIVEAVVEAMEAVPVPRPAPQPVPVAAPAADGGPEGASGEAPETGDDDRVPETGEDRVPETGEDTAPDSGDDGAPDSGDDRVPETGEDRAPETGDDRVPETGEDRAPETGEDGAPESGGGSARDAANGRRPVAVEAPAPAPAPAPVASAAAVAGDPDAHQPTLEWDLPLEQLGEEADLDLEIAAARLEEGGHDEPRPQETPDAADATTPAPVPTPGAPAPPAGRSAMLPAAAVLAVSTVGALVASGVIAGDEPSPPIDTGLVPQQVTTRVPEGQARDVVDRLREAAAAAERERRADGRDAAPAPPPAPDAADATAPAPAAEPQSDATAEPQATDEPAAQAGDAAEPRGYVPAPGE